VNSCWVVHSLVAVVVFLVVSEIASQQPPFPDNDSASVATVLENYDAAKHTPVFYGNVMHKLVSVDQAAEADFDATKSHPSCVGFAFVTRPPTEPEKTASPPPIPDVTSCMHIFTHVFNSFSYSHMYWHHDRVW